MINLQKIATFYLFYLHMIPLQNCLPDILCMNKYCFIFCLSSYLVTLLPSWNYTANVLSVVLQIISVFEIHPQIWLYTSARILYSRHLLQQTMDHTRLNHLEISSIIIIEINLMCNSNVVMYTLTFLC